MSPESVSRRREIFLSGKELFLPQRRVIAMAKSVNWVSAIDRTFPMPGFRVRWVPWGQWDELDEQVQVAEDALVILEVPALPTPDSDGKLNTRQAAAFAKGPIRCVMNWLSQRRLCRQCLVAILPSVLLEDCLPTYRHGLAQLGFASFLSTFAELDRLSGIACRHFERLGRSAGQTVAGEERVSGLSSISPPRSAAISLEQQVARNLPWG